jgi:hypothetical protein
MNDGLLSSPRGSGRRLRRSLYDYVLVEERYAAGTKAGSAPAALTWFTRTLNTLVYDTAGIVVLRSNRLRIPAGSYRVSAAVMSARDQRTRGRVRDVTNGVTLALSPAPHAHTYRTVQVLSLVTGTFETAGDIEIELQMYVQRDDNQTYDLGHDGGSNGELETFATLELTRVRA